MLRLKFSRNDLDIENGTVCPQKIRSLGIDTIFDAIFYEDCRVMRGESDRGANPTVLGTKYHLDLK